MIQTKYANAYTEVYEILSCLNEEEYSKIPEELIEVFEENRNLDYDYEVNEEQDLMEQPMLRETKAILLNIFRDYLATPEQSQKIKMWLQLVRRMAKFNARIWRFFYEDDGIYTASLIDKELKLYNLDFDRIKNLIQKLKDFEKKYGELYKEEKDNLLKRKDILLDLKTQTNGIDEFYRKMSNMYEFIEDYWKYLGDLKIIGKYEWFT